MDFQKMADYRNTHNPYAQRLGVFVEEIAPGYARATKTIDAQDVNPLGRAHGGVYLSLSDTVSAAATSSYGYMAVTLSSNFNFFRSAGIGDTLTAEAREVKGGNTVCVYEVHITDQNEKLLGSGTLTFYRTEKKINI